MFRPFSEVISRSYNEIKLCKHKVVRPNGIPWGKTNLMLSKPTNCINNVQYVNCVLLIFCYLLDNTRLYIPLSCLNHFAYSTNTTVWNPPSLLLNMAELNLALIPRKKGYLERNTITSRGFTLCHLKNVGGKVRTVKNTHSRDKRFSCVLSTWYYINCWG
jgi:hypothetical protein